MSFALRLRARECTSCGICEDVCAPGALRLRPVDASGAAGAFPFLALPAACDGCRDCAAQCPSACLEIAPLTPAASSSSC